MKSPFSAYFVISELRSHEVSEGGLPWKLQVKRKKQKAIHLLGTRLIEREASCRQINDGSPQAAESAGIKKSHMPQVFE